MLTSELDFETKRLYQVIVEALDRASLGEVNTAQATILVEVQMNPVKGLLNIKIISTFPGVGYC